MVKKKKKNFAKRFFITIFLILLFSAAGFAAYGYFLSAKMNTGDIAAKKVDIKKPVNILVLGVDAGNPKDKTSSNRRRSDTMMVVRYDPTTDKVYMLSLPRDTRVNIDGRIEKLNAAHAFGGVPLAISTIESMLNININYYLKIDYAGFKKCIDAVGGVDMVIPRDMDYDSHEISIHFKKGEKVHLDGEKAEQFVRWRKNNHGGGYAMGDIGRVGTQQEFIIKVLEKLKTPEGILRIPDLLNTISKYASTNMDYGTMLRYSAKITKVNSENIEKRILEGEPKYINGVSYYIWNEEKNADYLAVFRGDYSDNSYVDSSDSGNQSDTNKQSEDVNKNSINVTVLNSTGHNGLAAEYKTKLHSLGYNVIGTGNYSKKLLTTTINDYSSNNYGNAVYNDLNIGVVKQRSSNEVKSDVVIILGTDSIK